MVVRKKEEGNYTDFRKCGDRKPLNQETTPDRYPLPHRGHLRPNGGSENLKQGAPAQWLPSNGQTTF